MSFHGFSDAPDMLSSVRCVLVNALRWIPEHRRWSTSGDTHPGGHFAELEMLGKYDMHYRQPVSFGSLANESYRLSIQGHPIEGGLEYCRIKTAATWRLEFRLEDVAGRAVQQFLCFRWDGEGKAPAPIDNCANAEWQV